MKRISILAALSLLAMLVMAPTAGAQNGGAQEGLESFCADGGFPAAPQGAQQGGGGDLLCFPRQEQAQTYNQTGQIEGDGPIYNPSTGEVIRPAASPDDSQYEQPPATGGMTDLPDTGGIGLGGIAAGLGVALVAGGLLVRRRLS